MFGVCTYSPSTLNAFIYRKTGDPDGLKVQSRTYIWIFQNNNFIGKGIVNSIVDIYIYVYTCCLPSALITLY